MKENVEAPLQQRAERRNHKQTQLRSRRQSHHLFQSPTALAQPLEYHSTRRWVSWGQHFTGLFRILMGTLCTLDAWPKWFPAYSIQLQRDLVLASHTRIPFIAAWFTWWSHITGLQPHLFASVIALMETALALGLLMGTFTNLACGIGVVLTLIGCIGLAGCQEISEQGILDTGIVAVSLFAFLGLMISNAGQIFGLDARIWSHLRRGKLLASAPVASSIWTTSIPYILTSHTHYQQRAALKKHKTLVH